MNLLDLFRGRAITIPPLDGAFRPNAALDEADLFAALPAPRDLVASEGGLVTASGADLLGLEADAPPRLLGQAPGIISALAARPGGGLAVALEDGRLLLWQDGAFTALPAPADLPGATALLFQGPDRLILAIGSASLGPAVWAEAVMRQDRTGSLWQIDLPAGAPRRLAAGLAFPWGLATAADGRLVAAETAAHRLVALDGRGGLTQLLAGLPGYPARLAPATGGGAWLALAAPSNRLVEFVLREGAYRRAMLREVEPRFWIAPALRTGESFLEPLQCGAVRSMGVHKPWAPSRSYGLVARLGPDFQPQASFHSRADGQRHGVTAVADAGGVVYAAIEGGDCVVRIV